MSGCRRGRPNAIQGTARPPSRRPCAGKAMSEPMTMSRIATMLQVSRTFGVRDGMLRLEYELQRGSGLLSWRMRSVQGWDSWDLKRIADGTSPKDMRTTRRDGTRSFFFSDAQ